MRRKRNLLILYMLLTGIVFYFVQILFFNVYLSIGGIAPDLLLILTAFIGMRLGPIPGALFGFVSGLAQDATIDFFGLHALANTVVGFTADKLGVRKVLLVEKYYFVVMVLVLSLIHGVIYYGILSLEGPVYFWYQISYYGLPNSLYSATTTFVLWLLIPASLLEFVHFDVRYEY